MRQHLIPLSSVTVPDRFRQDYGDIESLKISIAERGLINPITVKDEGDGTYKLLAGGRRHRAVSELKWADVPARIYERQLLELDEKAIELAENADRKDFDWRERIKLEQRIHELQVGIHGEKFSTQPNATGWSLRDTATLLSRSPASISKDLSLAQALETLPVLAGCKTKDDAQKMLRNIQTSMMKAELSERITTEALTKPEDAKRNHLASCYIVGDTFRGLSQIQSGVIQFIDCDPPYGIDLDRSAKGFQSGKLAHDPNQYHEVRRNVYEDFLETLIAECYRVMTRNSWMTFWFGVDPWANTVYEILEKVGFKTTRTFGIWHKAKPPYHCSQPDTHLASAYDAFYYCRKGDAALFKQGRGNVFHYAPVPRKVHPTEKPIELMTELLSLFTLPGCQVLVPFLGSGNTLLAAANLNCPAAGYDLSEAYKNDFRLKCFESPYGQYTSYGA
jgi:site-specific DNA-methyltransferase (adenine-specific)